MKMFEFLTRPLSMTQRASPAHTTAAGELQARNMRPSDVFLLQITPDGVRTEWKKWTDGRTEKKKSHKTNNSLERDVSPTSLSSMSGSGLTSAISSLISLPFLAGSAGVEVVEERKENVEKLIIT